MTNTSLDPCVTAFLDAECDIGVGYYAVTKDVTAAYEKWRLEMGFVPISPKLMGRILRRLGMRPWRSRAERRWLGFRLKAQAATQEPMVVKDGKPPAGWREEKEEEEPFLEF